jgi:hypothetical protein
MNTLKDLLFDKPGFTGKNDSMGTCIFVGDTLRDHNGLEVKVFEPMPKCFTVGQDEMEASSGPSLNLWLSMSQTIEVVPLVASVQNSDDA